VWSEDREAVILRGAALAWPAIGEWSPEFFAERYGSISVPCYRNLPDSMVPQAHKDAKHRGVESVAEFVGHLRQGERCYLHSTNAGLFPGLDAFFNFRPLLPDAPDPVFVKLWFGAKTRSGLHFDPRDNLFAQIHGRKRVYLVAPTDNGCTYPLPADITKSQVDPIEDRHPEQPAFDNATVYEGILDPGDILVIPRGWWHHICAEDVSISLNCFFGEPMSLVDLAGVVTEASPFLWLPIVRDAVRYGLCGARFDPGLFATPPSGKLFFDIVFNRHGIRTLIPLRR
jgi:lysine-specific demethylase 8